MPAVFYRFGSRVSTSHSHFALLWYSFGRESSQRLDSLGSVRLLATRTPSPPSVTMLHVSPTSAVEQPFLYMSSLNRVLALEYNRHICLHSVR